MKNPPSAFPQKPWRKARLREGTSLRAMRQRTLDSMDRIDAQDQALGPRQSAAPLVAMDSAELEGFDRMVVLDGIRKDPGCRLVARMMKCSLDAAAENILAQVEQGNMTIGIHEGQIRVGITRDGWAQVARKLK